MTHIQHRPKLIAAVSILSLLIAGCHPKPKTPKGQVSYAIGMQFGRSLKSQALDLDVKLLNEGIKDALTNERPALSDEEMQAAVARLGDERQQTMKTEAEKNKKGSEDFLTKNKTAPDVKVTASGLQYKITREGAGPSPKIDDTVVVNYKGTLIDGSEFDSSFKRNAPAEFPIRGVIPGWTEGLQLMKKGGTATFYVPPELGYGDRARQQIPANAVLTFEVELLDVKPGKPAAKPQGKK